MRLALAFLLFATGAHAQSDYAPVSLTVGMGPTGSGGMHVGISPSVQIGRGVAAARLSTNQLDNVVGSGLLGSARDYTQEASVLVGVAQPVVGRWQATALAGVSANQTTRFEPGVCSDFLIFCISGKARSDRGSVRAGVPVEVGFSGPVAGAFGMGVRAFANLNRDETYRGVAVELRLNPRRGRR